MVTIAATAADDRADVGVDGFDDPEGDRVAAVAEDAVEMSLQRRGELLKRWQPLPADAAHPVGEEPARGPFVGVGPEPLDVFLEKVGFKQSAIERKGLGERPALLAARGVKRSEGPQMVSRPHPPTHRTPA